MKLDKDTWYWVTHPYEGDIYYPVLATGTGYIQMDGKHYVEEEMSGLIFIKAVMPDVSTDA